MTVLFATLLYMFSDVKENDRVIDTRQRNDYLRGYPSNVVPKSNFNQNQNDSFNQYQNQIQNQNQHDSFHQNEANHNSDFYPTSYNNQNAIQSNTNLNRISNQNAISNESKEANRLHSNGPDTNESKPSRNNPSINDFNNPTGNSYFPVRDQPPNKKPPPQQNHKTYEGTWSNNHRTNIDKSYLNPDENEADKKLVNTIDRLKSDIEMMEETGLAKEEQLVLDNEIQKVNEHVEEVLENVFEREEIEMSKGKIHELASEVKSKLVQNVQSELLDKADEIVIQKEEELDLVVIEDKQIFANTSDVVNDVKEMEKFIVEEMDQEIEELAEIIKDEIPEKLKHIEQDVIEKVIGMHINEEVLVEEEIKVEQKLENENREKEMKQNEEKEKLLKKITKIKLNIAEVKNAVVEQENLVLVTYLEEKEADSNEVLKRVFESKSANLTKSVRDYIVNETNTRLRTAVELEMNELSDLILSDTEIKVDRTVEEDQTYMQNVNDIKKDLKNTEKSIIEELQNELHKAAKDVRNSIPQKIAHFEKEIIKEKSDISIDDQELRDLRLEVERERKDND